jgi:hypothetical protein
MILLKKSSVTVSMPTKLELFLSFLLEGVGERGDQILDANQQRKFNKSLATYNLYNH